MLSTASARGRLGAAAVRALSSWEHVELARPGGGVLRVTGVPARHGPAGSEHQAGEVTGFLLSGEGLTLPSDSAVEAARILGARHITRVR